MVPDLSVAGGNNESVSCVAIKMTKLLYNNDFLGALVYLRESVATPRILERCIQVYIAGVNASARWCASS